jgi:hypothetical protein
LSLYLNGLLWIWVVDFVRINALGSYGAASTSLGGAIQGWNTGQELGP